MTVRLGLAVTATLVLLPAPAWPQRADKALEEAKRLFQKGQKHYDVAEFDQALEAYKAAYKVKELPAFLFNIGQCHRLLRNYGQAAFFYNRYLALEPKARNRQQVEQFVAEMEKKQAEEAMAKAAPSPQPSAPKAAEPRPLPPPPVVVLATRTLAAQPDVAAPPEAVAVEAAPEGPSPLYKKWWLWTGAAAVVAAGVVTAVLVAGNQKPPDCATNTTLGCIPMPQQ